jgi:phage tail protein X
MATKFTEYTTKEGDRWDTIAYAAYGDTGRMMEIAEANPDVPLRGKIPAGTVLFVPVTEEIETDINLLPPWKR